MKRRWGRARLAWLAAVVVSILAVTGIAGPASAADEGRRAVVQVVDPAGKPISGVGVDLWETGVTYPDYPAECNDHWCTDASGITDAQGYVYSDWGSLKTRYRYDIDVAYWDVPYYSDHIDKHPEWGSSPYKSVTTDADGRPIKVVLTPPMIYGTVTDESNTHYLIGTYLAYEVTSAGLQGKLAQTVSTDSNDQDFWGNGGKFAFNRLIQGKKYKIYAKDMSGSSLAVGNQWVGGNSFASAKTFVAGGAQSQLRLHGVKRLITSTAAPKLTGTSRVGERLSVNRGSWAGAPTAYAYQWLRDGRTIGGATKSTYTVTASDLSKRLSVKVTAKRSGFVSGSKTSNATGKVVAGLFSTSAAPKVSGTLRVGSRLAVSRGSWAGNPSSIGYQWRRDGKAIKGATKSSLTLSAADRGRRMSVDVTAKRAGFTTTVRRANTNGKVSAGVLSLKKAPAVSGTQLVGRKLSVSKGSWAVKPTSFSYRWYRSGKAIKGATKSTYKVATADRGKKISARVWAKKSGYNTKSASTSAKYIYASGLKMGTVSVKGAKTVGKTLKVAVSKPSGVKVKYQWYRNGSAIKGATKATYKLRDDDWLERVSVKVWFSKAGLPTVSKRSAKVYVPNHPDYEDYGYEDDYESSGSDSGYNGPKCWAPGGKTWRPC